MESSDTNSLIQKCISGERAAQKRFFDLYGPFVKGVVWKYFDDPASAEDAFINAMYKIFSNMEKLEDQEKLLSWMKTIAVNEALMIKRKRKRMDQTEAISEQVKEMSTHPKYDLDKELIMNVLSQLPEGYRSVFNLYEIDGYKHREIADILGISINTSKSQLIMAKKKLRELLVNIGFDLE